MFESALEALRSAGVPAPPEAHAEAYLAAQVRRPLLQAEAWAARRQHTQVKTAYHKAKQARSDEAGGLKVALCAASERLVDAEWRLDVLDEFTSMAEEVYPDLPADMAAPVAATLEERLADAFGLLLESH